MNDSAAIVQKLWNYCNILRDDGLSYQDYIEQLTSLLFLKMADEQTRPPFNRPSIVPAGLDWETLARRDGDALEVQYRQTLAELGRQLGTLGVIFRKAQNKIQDPSKLKRLVSELIGKEQWMTMDADVKGDAYEGLLAKNAEDVKSGAGQYFTPRPLIRAIVDVMRPNAAHRVADPAAGTGGFLLAAYERMKSPDLDPDEKRFLRDEALRGWEIVDATARLCAMNLLLHGIGARKARASSAWTTPSALRRPSTSTWCSPILPMRFSLVRGDAARNGVEGDNPPWTLSVSVASNLLPHLASLRILSIESPGDCAVIDPIPRARTVCCPPCSQRSRHLHSRHRRTVYDPPYGHRFVLLRLRAGPFAVGTRRARGVFSVNVRPPSFTPASHARRIASCRPRTLSSNGERRSWTRYEKLRAANTEATSTPIAHPAPQTIWVRLRLG